MGTHFSLLFGGRRSTGMIFAKLHDLERDELTSHLVGDHTRPALTDKEIPDDTLVKA